MKNPVSHLPSAARQARKAVKNKISDGVENVMLRTRQSLRIFEAIEKTPLRKAKKLADRGLQMSSLKLLGFVTQAEVESLRIRIEQLEAQVTLLSEKKAAKRVR